MEDSLVKAAFVQTYFKVGSCIFAFCLEILLEVPMLER